MPQQVAGLVSGWRLHMLGACRGPLWAMAQVHAPVLGRAGDSELLSTRCTPQHHGVGARANHLAPD